MKISELFNIQTGYLKSRVSNEDLNDSYIIYTKKHFDVNQNYSNDFTNIELEEIKLDSSKVVLTKENEVIIDSLSRKSSIVSKETENMFLAFNYFRLTPKTKTVDLDYFCSWFNLSEDLELQINRIIQGTIVKKLSLKQLGELTIDLPPYDLQVRIGQLYKESLKKFNIAKEIKDNEDNIIRKIMGGTDE